MSRRSAGRSTPRWRSTLPASSPPSFVSWFGIRLPDTGGPQGWVPLGQRVCRPGLIPRRNGNYHCRMELRRGTAVAPGRAVARKVSGMATFCTAHNNGSWKLAARARERRACEGVSSDLRGRRRMGSMRTGSRLRFACAALTFATAPAGGQDVPRYERIECAFPLPAGAALLSSICFPFSTAPSTGASSRSS